MTIELSKRIRGLVQELAGGPLPAINEEDNLLESGVLDSTGFFELIARVEQELGLAVDFLSADPADLVSIGGLARHLAEPRPPAPQPAGGTPAPL